MENNENNAQKQVNETVNKPQKSGKKVTIILGIIVLILVLALGVCAGLLISGNGKKIINQIEEKIVQNDENKTCKKIDESKDWVYDAEYLKENKKIYQDSAKTEEYAVNTDKDLVVPFININSEAAKTVNENIKALYEEYYAKYGTVSKSYSDMEYTVYEHYELDYEKYINDNILSVVITLHEGSVVVDGGTGGGTFTKYTYNFNLDTLNEATLDEMAKKCGFDSGDEVTKKVEAWERRQEELAKKYTGFIGATMDGVQKGKYFIDSNKKMNFIYKFSAASSGDTTGIVEPNKDIEDFYDENELIEAQKVFENNQATNKTENKSSNISNSNYIEEYKKIIDKIEAEYPNNEIKYDLIYFNNDDIPDLVLGVQGYWVSVYIYEDGNIYNPIDEWSYGIGGAKYYDFLEKKGVVYNYGNSYAGAISYVTYYLLNSEHKFDTLVYTRKEEGIISENSQFFEENPQIYEEIQKAEDACYYNEQKISEEEFNNKLKESSVSSNEKDYKGLEGSRTAEEIKNQLQK